MFHLRTLKTIALTFGIGVAAILQSSTADARDIQTVAIAGGCFWCVESDFESVQGVSEAISGYISGPSGNDYETVEIQFDRDQITERELYDLFFRSIDPIDAGGQFCDRGSTYRTAIFYTNPAQLSAAQAAKTAAELELGQPIVTAILEASTFRVARDYHQDFYRGEQTVVTRRGLKTQAEAYAFYRTACGRDQRVEELWGSDAPFLKH